MGEGDRGAGAADDFRRGVIRNPGAYYFSTQGPNDWIEPRNDALWQDGVKTLFDPCPAGWRVPLGGEGALSPWTDFALAGTYEPNTPDADPGTGITAGYHFHSATEGKLCWYPFSGYRGAVLATVQFCGAASRHHVSSCRGSSASYLLYLQESSVLVSTHAMRAYGYPVRCVRE